MTDTIDPLEDRINAILATQTDLQEIVFEGGFVGVARRSFYEIIHHENHPDIMDALRGKVLLLIDGTHVRILDSLEEAIDFRKGLQSPVKVIQGPPETDITMAELEGGDSA